MVAVGLALEEDVAGRVVEVHHSLVVDEGGEAGKVVGHRLVTAFGGVAEFIHTVGVGALHADEIGVA